MRLGTVLSFLCCFFFLLEGEEQASVPNRVSGRGISTGDSSSRSRSPAGVRVLGLGTGIGIYSRIYLFTLEPREKKTRSRGCVSCVLLAYYAELYPAHINRAVDKLIQKAVPHLTASKLHKTTAFQLRKPSVLLIFAQNHELIAQNHHI